MRLKCADDKTPDIAILDALAKRPNAPAETRKKIEQEIRNIRAGVNGEAEAAYEMDFQLTSRNWMVIHDLRLEHGGRVAQIDHLVINRFLQVFVCESKRFSEGVALNENGEFAAFYNGKPRGMPSPLEQNEKHMQVLAAIFKDGVVDLPRRLGFTLTPVIKGYVLVSKSARISRPKVALPGLDCIVKADQFVSRLTREDDGPMSMARVVGQDTLEALGRQLAALHKPLQFDWEAKFGLKSQPYSQDAVALDIVVPAAPNEHAPANPAKVKLVCSTCAIPVSYAVAKFCWNSRKLNGKVLCMSCQKTQ